MQSPGLTASVAAVPQRQRRRTLGAPRRAVLSPRKMHVPVRASPGAYGQRLSRDEKEIQMADKPVFLFLGVYGNPVEATGRPGARAPPAHRRRDRHLRRRRRRQAGRRHRHCGQVGEAHPARRLDRHRRRRGRGHPLPALDPRHGRPRRCGRRTHRPLLARHAAQRRARARRGPRHRRGAAHRRRSRQARPGAAARPASRPRSSSRSRSTWRARTSTGSSARPRRSWRRPEHARFRSRPAGG